MPRKRASGGRTGGRRTIVTPTEKIVAGSGRVDIYRDGVGSGRSRTGRQKHDGELHDHEFAHVRKDGVSEVGVVPRSYRHIGYNAAQVHQSAKTVAANLRTGADSAALESSVAGLMRSVETLEVNIRSARVNLDAAKRPGTPTHDRLFGNADRAVTIAENAMGRAVAAVGEARSHARVASERVGDVKALMADPVKNSAAVALAAASEQAAKAALASAEQAARNAAAVAEEAAKAGDAAAEELAKASRAAAEQAAKAARAAAEQAEKATRSAIETAVKAAKAAAEQALKIAKAAAEQALKASKFAIEMAGRAAAATLAAMASAFER